MSYQALARKWRPRNFSELVGQTHVRTALENALGQGRLHPALLFSGTRGVGKTTLARIIARSLNCETGPTATPCGTCAACEEIEQGRFVDLIEVDAASRTKVDETRELLDNVPYAPARGRVKVYLIDEVHMLTKHSFNALLKTLEEPPSHVQFLFATTDPQKLPITILSRCLQFHLKRISQADIGGRIKHILDAEGVSYDDSGVQRVARAADGSLRDGLSLLDQAIAFGGGAVTGEAVASMLGTIERKDLLDLVLAIGQGQSDACWAAIDRIEEQGLDFAEVLEELCRLWQRLAVGQMVPQALDETEAEDLADMLQAFSPEDLQVHYQIAITSRRDFDWAPDPRSGFEMCVLRSLAFLPEGAASGPPPKPSRSLPRPAAAPATRAQAESKPVQEKAATPPVTEAPKPVAASTIPLNADWKQYLAALDLQGPSLVLAQSCEILSRDEQSLVLSLGSQSSSMLTPKAKQKLLDALQKLLGDTIKVDIQKSDKPSAAVAEQQSLSPEEKFLADPQVNAVVQMFDAKLQPGTLRMAGDD